MKLVLFFCVVVSSFIFSTQALGVIGEPSSPEEWESQVQFISEDPRVYRDVLDTIKNKKDYLVLMDQFSLEDIRATAALAAQHGLDPAKYWTSEMEASFSRNSSVNNVDLRAKASDKFLRLLKDVSVGITNPQSLGEDFKIAQKPLISLEDLRALIVASGNRAEEVVKTLAPRNAFYETLRRTYVNTLEVCARGEWQPLPKMKKELRLGTRDPFVPVLRTRLQQLGYKVTSTDDLYNEEMQKAVQDIQATMKMKPDGRVTPGARTFQYLNTSCQSRVRQLQADVEKLRWLPSDWGQRYIFVNLAFQQFLLRDARQGINQTMTFRTINGRPERKTPMMNDRVDHIVLNPYWVVPPTIFIEDKVEDIKKLNSWQINEYFRRHNYEVWNKNFTRQYNPSSIDWWSIDSKDDVDIYIRQRPFLGNALGVLKFMLTNPYAIYLHDTNQRELFGEANRQLSSGCVRLERPVDVAEFLLRGTKWTRENIEATLAKPGQVMDRDTKVKLQEYIPVFLVNLTSLPASDGILRFTEDSYDQNTRINALQTSPL